MAADVVTVEGTAPEVVAVEFIEPIAPRDRMRGLNLVDADFRPSMLAVPPACPQEVLVREEDRVHRFERSVERARTVDPQRTLIGLDAKTPTPEVRFRVQSTHAIGHRRGHDPGPAVRLLGCDEAVARRPAQPALVRHLLVEALPGLPADRERHNDIHRAPYPDRFAPSRHPLADPLGHRIVRGGGPVRTAAAATRGIVGPTRATPASC